MESDFADFKIHSLVIWDKYIYPKNVHKLLGVTGVFNREGVRLVVILKMNANKNLLVRSLQQLTIV